MSNYPKVEEGIFDTVKNNTEQFLEIVGQYFPEAIKDGEVDFTALKEEMGEFQEVKGEHYDFTWAGKQAAKKESQADIYGRTLKFKPQDSVNAETTENIYIEGDNLEALKLLKKNYYGKIKMIYIDPPYNTGSDFVYRDDFTMSEEELAELSGNAVNGERLQKNSKDKAKYHTNWLNMMYPRLKLARDLLSEDGVIFISIDENEIQNMRKICDEIFGESNFISQLGWQKVYSPKNQARYFSNDYEFVLCYARVIDCFTLGMLPRTPEMNARYKNPDNDPRGDWKPGDCVGAGERKNGYYDVVSPITGKCFNVPKGKHWVYAPETMKRLLEENRIYFGKDGNAFPAVKQFLSDVSGRRPSNLLLYEDYGHTDMAKKDLIKLFSDLIKPPFDTPKPIKLIKMLSYIGSCDGDIILDFFSGAATTAQSIFELNAEQGSKRKFILVQLPEVVQNNDGAIQIGLTNLCEVGKERIRRAAKKIHEDNPNAVFDDGFKVFEVADTNIRWNQIDDREIYDIDYSKGIKDDIDFMPGVNDIDIVYEIMLKQYGIPLSTPIEKLSDISDRTYIFADAVVVCLDADITDELIEKLAAIEPIPAKYILRDSAFDDDIEFKDVSYRRLSALISNHQTDEEKKSKYNNFTVEFI